MIKKLIKGFVGLSVVPLVAALIPTGVEPFEINTVTDHETIFTTMDTQSGVTWGLDRIDGVVDNNYTYISNGAGTRIYIVDTGVDATHPDFGARVVDGFDAFGSNLDQTDCNGHGTHVAGISAGNYFGVAKSATIVPVRVLNCSGQGNTTTLTAGIEWILANHNSNYPAIVNMSLGGPKDLEVNAATERLISAGMVVVVAAGNSNVDACTFSPASAQGVISVGSISSGDSRSGFSNWGNCVDIFAPGSKINSDSPFNHSLSVQKSGTSQAAPFVAGIIATYISNGIASSRVTAENKLYELSEIGTVLDSKSPRDAIASVEKANTPESDAPSLAPAPPTTTPEPVIESPAPTTPEPDANIVESELLLSVSDVKAKSATASWLNVFGADKYVLQAGLVGGSGYTHRLTSQGTSENLDNLRSNSNYWIIVSAYSKDTLIATSDKLTISTSYGIADSPLQATVKLDRLSWKAPAYMGGVKYPTYIVEKLVENSWKEVTSTTELFVAIVPAKSGISDVYRVLTSTPAGLSLPSNVAISVGSDLPQVTTPTPDLPLDMAGTVVATQMGGGSGFVELVWGPLEGNTTYSIQKSPHGIEDWATVSSTSKTRKIITIKTKIDYELRVVALDGTVIGVIQYRGN
jgi:hypothetical protein